MSRCEGCEWEECRDCYRHRVIVHIFGMLAMLSVMWLWLAVALDALFD